MDFDFKKPGSDDIAEIEAFKAECEAAGSGMDGTGILYRSTAAEWLEYIDSIENISDTNWVRCRQFGLFECGTNRLLGLLQVRLDLKGYLVDYGGHIGYCVRPCERRKGYAKEMLRRSLEFCREEGLDRVLITCLEDNIGSSKTIESCGGIFEKIVYDDVNYHANMKRYWIALT